MPVPPVSAPIGCAAIEAPEPALGAPDGQAGPASQSVHGPVGHWWAAALCCCGDPVPRPPLENRLRGRQALAGELCFGQRRNFVAGLPDQGGAAYS